MVGALREIGARLLSEVRPGAGGAGAYYPPSTASDSRVRGAGGDRSFPLDLKAEEIVLEGLEATGRPFTVISEEAGLVEINGGGRAVVLDPIDGSRNAVTGIPYFGTSIAVADGETLGDVSVAYVVNLASGGEFWAESDGGAFCPTGRLAAQADDVLYLVAYEAQTPGRDVTRILPLFAQARRTRCLGAIALDLAYLASGGVSVFVTPTPSRSFDIAGGWLLVREAGGVITDLEGNDIGSTPLGLKRMTPILASGNSALHKKALGLLSSNGPDGSGGHS